MAFKRMVEQENRISLTAQTTNCLINTFISYVVVQVAA